MTANGQRRRRGRRGPPRGWPRPASSAAGGGHHRLLAIGGQLEDVGARRCRSSFRRLKRSRARWRSSISSRQARAAPAPVQQGSGARRSRPPGWPSSRDQVGVALEHLRQQPAGAQQPAQPPGRLGRLAEGDGQLPRLGVARRQDRAARAARGRGRATPTASRAAAAASAASGATSGSGPASAPRGRWRVRSASVKPKAARRAATASGDISGRAAGAGEGLEQRAEAEALVDATAPSPGGGAARRRAARRRRPSGVSAVAEDPGQAVRGRQSSAGRVWTCCSSTSCSRCSTARRNR